jgi:Calcineurin-like phosphoesterase
MAAQFHVLSDLHLEAPAAYDVFNIPARAPYLALLGDIGDSRSKGLVDFLAKQLTKFEIVFFLLGNHEPYHGSWGDVKARIHAFGWAVAQRTKNEESLGKFVFLDQTRYDISSYVTVLGCTLYSKFLDDQLEDVSFGLNDFYHIKDRDVHLHRQAHSSDLKWLNEQVRSISQAEPNQRVVILTHHSPVFGGQATDPKHAKSSFTSGFLQIFLAKNAGIIPGSSFGRLVTHISIVTTKMRRPESES